jgi:hypothetical protein
MFANFTNSSNAQKREWQTLQAPYKSTTAMDTNSNEKHPLQNIPFLNYFAGGQKINDNINSTCNMQTDDTEVMSMQQGNNGCLYQNEKEGNYNQDDGKEGYKSHSKME